MILENKPCNTRLVCLGAILKEVSLWQRSQMKMPLLIQRNLLSLAVNHQLKVKLRNLKSSQRKKKPN
jgi:hypothetical protein